MSTYLICPKCDKIVMPGASEWTKNTGRICLCDTTPHAAPRMPVQATETPKGNKYGARKTECDGTLFDSQKEAQRYKELCLMEKAGEISGLELQPKYEFVVNRVLVCTYKPDFRYLRDGKVVVEDVKSKATRTRDYVIRRNLMKACHGIEVTEV